MTRLRKWINGDKAAKVEAEADRAEDRVEKLEDRGAEQTARLNKATERVTKSVGAVKRIEALGNAYERAEEERRGHA